MTSLSNVQHNIVRGINRSSLIVRKYSPEILLGIGLAGMVVSTILASRATLKAEGILKTHKSSMDTIDKVASSENPPIGYDADVELQDRAIVYTKTGFEFAKLYGPAVGVGVLSIAAILSSHGLMKRREVGLIAGYNLIAESFSAYRKRVVDELGPDIDRNYRYGIVESEYTEKETDSDGNVVKTKKTQKTLMTKKNSGFSKFFDEYSTQYQKSAETNLYFLRMEQNYVNDLLKARGHVFLNEVYDRLGLPRTKEGSIYGWLMNGDGTTVIDFDIYNIDNPAGRAFVNGYEKAILLDFNVTGIIWDQI